MSAAYNINTPTAPQDVFNPSQEQFEKIVFELGQASEIFALDSDGLEHHLHLQGRELLRLLLQAHYDLRAPAQPTDDIVCCESVVRTFTRRAGRLMNTRFGCIRVRRIAHCCADMPQLCPLDADLNLSPKKSSRNVQKLACEHCRDVSFDASQVMLAQITGRKIGHRQLEEIVVDVAQDFETFYDQRQPNEVQTSNHHLIITTDGKGVAMIERDLRPATKKRAQERRRRGEEKKRHLGSGEKRDRKRMSIVASVYNHIPNPRTAESIMTGSRLNVRRENVENKRVWADLMRSTRECVEEAFEEAKRRDPSGSRQWAMLVDGDPKQMDAVMEQVEALQAKGFAILVIVDLIHVAEYLWRAANALFGAKSAKREVWVRRQVLRLLRGEAKGVAHGVRVSGGKKGLKGRRLKAVQECARYIENRVEYLKYNEAIEVGLPIATGVIEGACRYLVKDRLGITGAKWSLDVAQAILRLRALDASEDWEAYWAWHKQRSFDRDHATRYDQQIPPKLVYTALANHLCIVK